MMGIPLNGPANAVSDNETMVKNSTIPSSCYHFVRESFTTQTICIANIPSGQNLADMLTKSLGATKLHNFCQKILY